MLRARNSGSSLLAQGVNTNLLALHTPVLHDDFDPALPSEMLACKLKFILLSAVVLALVSAQVSAEGKH